MPRRARIVAENLPHHITQRGNSCQKVFKDDTDNRKYLNWVQEYSEKYKLSILAYCLMPNHIHFIAIPHKEDSLAKTFNTAHMRYAQYANKKMQRSGHLWQGRFFSCILDETYLIAAIRYVERNPVRAKLVDMPWNWIWSSAAAHIQKGTSLIRLENIFNIIDMDASEWKEYIESKEEESIIDSMKKHTLVGRPLGTGGFIEDLKKKLQVDFPVLKRGRPRKNE